MDKQLQVEFDNFDEEDTKRFKEYIKKEKNTGENYSEGEMVIFDCDKDEFLGRKYPEDIDFCDKSEE